MNLDKVTYNVDSHSLYRTLKPDNKTWKPGKEKRHALQSMKTCTPLSDIRNKLGVPVINHFTPFCISLTFTDIHWNSTKASTILCNHTGGGYCHSYLCQLLGCLCCYSCSISLGHEQLLSRVPGLRCRIVPSLHPPLLYLESSLRCLLLDLLQLPVGLFHLLPGLERQQLQVLLMIPLPVLQYLGQGGAFLVGQGHRPRAFHLGELPHRLLQGFQEIELCSHFELERTGRVELGSWLENSWCERWGLWEKKKLEV